MIVMYKCTTCKRDIEEIGDKIRCPYCGARIFLKSRPEVVTKVRAK